MKRRKRGSGPIWFILLFLSGALYTYFNAGMVRCFFIRWSDFREVFDFNRSGYLLYVDPQFPRDKVGLLRSEIDAAKSRVAVLYGGFTDRPVIIVSDRPDPVRRYGVDRGKTALSYISLAGSYIVLGPGGTNPDVIAHELSHAELARRIGVMGRLKIPAWFDEGLAMQVGYRPQYGESEWRRITKDGRSAPDMAAIAKPDRFYGDEPEAHSILARHEVGLWLARVGKKGLWELLGELKTGADFGEAYQAFQK